MSGSNYMFLNWNILVVCNLIHSFSLKVEDAIVYALAHHRLSSSLRFDLTGVNIIFIEMIYYE